MPTYFKMNFSFVHVDSTDMCSEGFLKIKLAGIADQLGEVIDCAKSQLHKIFKSIPQCAGTLQVRVDFPESLQLRPEIGTLLALIAQQYGFSSVDFSSELDGPPIRLSAALEQKEELVKESGQPLVSLDKSDKQKQPKQVLIVGCNYKREVLRTIIDAFVNQGCRVLRLHLISVLTPQSAIGCYVEDHEVRHIDFVMSSFQLALVGEHKVPDARGDCAVIAILKEAGIPCVAVCKHGPGEHIPRQRAGAFLCLSPKQLATKLSNGELSAASLFEGSCLSARRQ